MEPSYPRDEVLKKEDWILRVKEGGEAGNTRQETRINGKMGRELRTRKKEE